MIPASIKIRKGFDIQLEGEAAKSIFTTTPRTVACKPTDFTGVFPKMLIQEGEAVQAGTPIYADKYREQVVFTAPVSGTVREIKRGPKRVIQEIIIETGKDIDYLDFGKADPNALTRDQIIEKMLKSGIWPVIRQRPYSIIANPFSHPKAIFISAFDTSPLGPDYNYMLEGQADIFQTGIDALHKLTSGKIHLNIHDDSAKSTFFLETKGVQVNRFSGTHPAGNISTQVSRLDPINKGEVIWYLRPQEVLTIGKLFLSGKYDATKIYAITGSMVKYPAYCKTLSGACVGDILNDHLHAGKLRVISGNVLTGTRIDKDDYAGFYDSQITVIPEGDHYEFLGWAMPGLNKFSFYNHFLSRLFTKKKYSLDTNLHGGERAFVLTGQYEKVFPFDIYPMQLLKAILAEDIDLMENLGIYEIDSEDFALIEFIDPSKIEIQSIVRKGLDMMRKETI